MADEPLIFISYASPDRDRVLPYYEYLISSGFDSWIDCRRIKGGQNWDFEIRRALNRAVIIVVFISNVSVDRRGYVQRELKLALDRAFEKLIDDIYVVPVLLDSDVFIPEQLRELHVIKTEDADALQNLKDSVSHQLTRLGERVSEEQDVSGVRWSRQIHRDAWDGLPGYEVECQFLRFSSSQYPHVSEVGDVIKGSLLSMAMSERMVKFDQDTESYNFGQSRHSRKNTWEAIVGEPKIKGNFLSVSYTLHSYYSGAAHPNSVFRSYCFLLDPLTRIERLPQLFSDADAALLVVQRSAREQLLADMAEGDEDEGRDESDQTGFIDNQLIEGGTTDWDAFHSFVLGDEGLEISFPPYQVACYAAGAFFVTIPYSAIEEFMVPYYRDALRV